MGLVAGLAAANVRHRPARWLLLALGVALALALPVVSAGAAKVVAAQTLRRTVDTLDAGDRTTTVTYQQTIFDKSAATGVSEAITTQLARLSRAAVRRQLLFRQLSTRGETFFLGAADNLGAAVRLVSGRLPASCRPTRCEVVLVGRGDQAALTVAGGDLGVVVVGRVERTDRGLVSGTFDPGGVALLLGNGVDAMALLDPLALFARTYGWVVGLDVSRIVRLGVPGYLALAGQVAADLDGQVRGSTVYSPDSTLQAQDERARVSARRFGLLGGSAAALLLGFAILAAIGLRRDHAVLVGVLRRRGATVPQVAAIAVAQCAVVCAAGAVLGAALGAAVTARLAASTGLPAMHTALSAAASPGGAVLALAAAVLAAAVLLWPDRPLWQASDLIAFSCLAAAVLASERGAADLVDRTDPLVVALPVLAAVTGGLAAARLWPPVTRMLARAVPQRMVALRIGLVGAVRRPLRPIATTAFLAAAVASVVFAGAYRATLLASAADQAAFAVPLDYTIARSREVANPLSVLDSAQIAGRDGRSFGIVRTAGILRTNDNNSRSVPIIGLEPDALPQVHSWPRTTGSSESAGAVAARLRLTTPPGPPIRAGRISIPFTGDVTPIRVSVWVASAEGRETSVALLRAGTVLTAVVPPLGAGMHVSAVEIGSDPTQAILREHATGEGSTARQAITGQVTLRPGWDWATWSTTSGTLRGDTISYVLDNSRVVLVPAPRAVPVLPVAVDPVTAAGARAGLLSLRLADLVVTARVVGVLPRLPSAGTSFLAADRTALAALFDRTSPGLGNVTELWVQGGELTGAPYDRLTVTSRTATRDDLASDPVGQGSRTLLLLAAVLALLIAAASLVLLVLGERSDGAGELFAWEADGVAPATLRRAIVARALNVLPVGLAIGLITGLVLAHAGTTLIAVDASGSLPVPPLQIAVGLGWTARLLVAILGGTALLVWVAAARLLRERMPVRPEVDLR